MSGMVLPPGVEQGAHLAIIWCMGEQEFPHFHLLQEHFSLLFYV